MKDFDKLYAELKEKFNAALIEFLRPYEKTVNENLYDAMKYSVVNSGKRIRPILCMLGARFVGADEDDVMTFAIALELIHTYSLVHDDLPAVDDDSMRRGKMTTHIMHGEAMGIFAGDALLNLAYEIMTENVVKTTDFKRLRAMELIMKAAGANGLLNGQAKDVDYDNCGDYFLEHIISMYRNKTADLIRASLVSGALIGGAKWTELEALSSYGDSLGIYFQLQDDLMDEGEEKFDMNMSVDEYLAFIGDENDGIEPPFGNPKTDLNGGAYPPFGNQKTDLNGGAYSPFGAEKAGSIFDLKDSGNDTPPSFGTQKPNLNGGAYPPFGNQKTDLNGGAYPPFGNQKTDEKHNLKEALNGMQPLSANQKINEKFNFQENPNGGIEPRFKNEKTQDASEDFQLENDGYTDKTDVKKLSELHKIDGEHSDRYMKTDTEKPFNRDTKTDGEPTDTKIDTKKLLGLDKTADEPPSARDTKIDAKKLLGLDKTADELLFNDDLKINGKVLLQMDKERYESQMFKSAKKEKMTFLKAAGEEETRKLMDEYEEYIREIAILYGSRAAELIGIFEFIKKREN